MSIIHRQTSTAGLNYYKTFIKNNIFLISSGFFIYGRGIILVPLLIKNIGLTSYGGYVLLTMGIGFISAISAFGSGFRLTRFLPSLENIAEKRSILYSQIIFQLMSVFAVSIILIAAEDFIKKTFFKGEINFSMFFVTLILLTYVFYKASVDYFRYTFKMICHSIAIAMESILTILFIIIIIFVFHVTSINALLLVNLLVMVVITIPLFLKIGKEIGFYPFPLDLQGFLKGVRLGLPLLLSYLLDFILSGSDRYVIGMLISAKAVGYYNPAYAIGSLIIAIPKICGQGVLFPLLSNAADNNKTDEMNTLIHYAAKLFLLCAIPFTVFCFVLSKPLLTLLADKEVAGTAYAVTPIVALGSLFYGLTLILSQILFVKLKTKDMFFINIFSAVANLVLNIIFISIFRNILVAALTTLFCYFIIFIFLHNKIKTYLPLKYDVSCIIKSTLASIMVGLLLNYAIVYVQYNFINVSLSLIMAGLLYFTLMVMLKSFNAKEINFIKGYLRLKDNREAD